MATSSRASRSAARSGDSYRVPAHVGRHKGTELLEAVTILPGRHAWHVMPDGAGGYAEQAIVPRLITDNAGQG